MHFCYLNQVKGSYTFNTVIVSIIKNSDKQKRVISKIHSISEMFLTTYSFYLIQMFYYLQPETENWPGCPIHPAIHKPKSSIFTWALNPWMLTSCLSQFQCGICHFCKGVLNGTVQSSKLSLWMYNTELSEVFENHLHRPLWFARAGPYTDGVSTTDQNWTPKHRGPNNKNVGKEFQGKKVITGEKLHT